MSGPNNTQHKIQEVLKNTDLTWREPQLYNLSNQSDLSRINELFESGSIVFVHDKADVFLSELFFEAHPDQKDNRDSIKFNDFINNIGDQAQYGVWVYYPWSKRLVHFPPTSELNNLRTSRNRDLVTTDEQEKLLDATIAIFGLSVGSNVAEALINQGIGKHFILADPDYLEPTNLNRVRSAFYEIGVNKVDVVAKKISELNPYAKITIFRDGLNKDNLSLITDKHKPSILIDEMDDLLMKISVRRKAQTISLPVVMATDNGDGALIDIERYDLDPNNQPFNGLIPEEVLRTLECNQLSRAETGSLVGKYFVGFDRVSSRMIHSLNEVGKSLPSWPQLGSAAALSGLLVAYTVKHILLGRNFSNTRYEINLEGILKPVGISGEEASDKQAAIERLMGNA